MIAVTDSDPQLVASLQAGDPQAVQTLVDRYWDRTYRVALHWVHDPGAAEDVAQETFVQALRRVGDLEKPGSFRSWFFRVLEGTARQHQRTQGRRRRNEARWQPGEPDHDPTRGAERHETTERLRRELAQLPDTVRQVLVLRFYQGQSLAEVAEQLSLPRPTVSSHIRRGLERLRRALGAAALAGVALPELITEACAQVPAPPAPAADALLAAREELAPQARAVEASLSVKDETPTAPARQVAPALISSLALLSTGGLLAALVAVLGDPVIGPSAAAIPARRDSAQTGEAPVEGGTTPPSSPGLPADRAAPSAGAALANAEPAEPTVTLRMIDVSAAEVLAEIERQSGRAVGLEGEPEEPVSLWVRDMPASQAIETVAALAQARVREEDGALIVQAPPRVTIQFTDADLPTVFELTAAYSGKRIDLPEQLEGKVTLDLKRVEWDLAVVAVAEVLGLVAYGDADTIWIRRPGDPVPPDAERLTLAGIEARRPRVHASPVGPRASAQATGLVSLPDDELALGVLTEALALHSGRPLLVEDPLLHQTPIRAGTRGLAWERALTSLLAAAEARAELRGDALVLTPRREVSLQFDDANVRTVLQLSSAYAGLNAVIHPEVRGQVTLDLARVPWDRAVPLIAGAVGAEARRVADLLIVAPPGAVAAGEPLAPAQLWLGEADDARVDLRGSYTAAQFVEAVHTQTLQRVRVSGAPRGSLPLDVNNASLDDACAAYARAAGLELHRDGLGAILRPPAARTRLLVYRAPARALLGFLGPRAGRNLVLLSSVHGEVDGPRTPFTSYAEALERCLQQAGVRVEPLPGGERVRGSSPPPEVDPEGETRPRPTFALAGATTRPLLPLQAVDLQELYPERSGALLGGRVYQVGSRLIDPWTDEELPATVVRIEADRVLVHYEELGARVWFVVEPAVGGGWSTRAQLAR